MPHPAVLISLWIFFSIALESFQTWMLLVAAMAAAAVAMRLSARRLVELLRRTRWIMFSLLLVYGYATPGDALWGVAGIFSPTQQGIFDGVMQILRLASMLAGLSIVLTLLPRQQLVSGLYALIFPLRYLGLSRERLAIRLALTLHYAETSMPDIAADWRGGLERMLVPPPGEHPAIELPAAPFTWRDGMLLIAGGTLLLALVLK